MAQEPENQKNTGLEELEELTQQDRITQIQFSEPELHPFNASDIFELKEEEKPRRGLFGKRSKRKATVRIRKEIFDDGQEIQEEAVTADSGEEPQPEPTVFSSSEDVAPAVDELLQTQMPQEEETVQETEVQVQPEEDSDEPTIEMDAVTEESLMEHNDGDEPEEEDSGEIDRQADQDIDHAGEVVLDAMTQDIEASQGQPDESETDRLREEDESDEGEEDEDEYDDDEDEYEDDDDEEEEEDEDGEYYDDEPDLFEDKKHFLLSQYPIIEDYLAEQSADGYHYVRHNGHKYYFTKGEPERYYYSIDYFRQEPDNEMWRKLEADGWQLVSKAPARKKKEAGWFIFRHPEETGEYPKVIENEEEKYRFFRKYANSCRSTMFLVFICMVCCLITAFLQYEFQGYLWGIAICAVLFVICLVVFFQYARMLKHAKKRARMLMARLRLKEQQKNRMDMESDEYDTSETEAQLESDWNDLEDDE